MGKEVNGHPPGLSRNTALPSTHATPGDVYTQPFCNAAEDRQHGRKRHSGIVGQKAWTFTPGLPRSSRKTMRHGVAGQAAPGLKVALVEIPPRPCPCGRCTFPYEPWAERFDLSFLPAPPRRDWVAVRDRASSAWVGSTMRNFTGRGSTSSPFGHAGVQPQPGAPKTGAQLGTLQVHG